MQLDGKTAIVTGAASGFGAGIARALAAEGARVLVADMNTQGAQEVASDIGGTPCTVDVADGASVQAMAEAGLAAFGHIDILVNNAGITRDNLSLRMSEEEFDEVISVNLRAVFVSCKAALRPMMRGRFGRIVNIGSTSGLIGNAGQANYAAAKAGVIGMTKSIARELGSKGVTANVVAPGFIQTDMTANLGEAVLGQIKDTVVVPRLGVPEDIASAVSYVSSDEAGYLTGQVITVDGGLTMS